MPNLNPWPRLKSWTGLGIDADRNTVPSDAMEETNSNASLATALANAHRNAVVCAAINWLSNQMKSTPLEMTERQNDDEVETVTNHPLLDLLNAPSEFMSGRELRAVSTRDMFNIGQAFWHKDRVRNGRIDSLTYLQARCVTVKGTREQLITEYEYDPGGPGGPITYQPGEIVHIRLEPNPLDPKNGLPLLDCVRWALLNHDQTMEHPSSIFDRGGNPGVLLVPPEHTVLTPELAKETKDYIRKEFAGKRRGELGVLRAFMEFINTNLTPDDLNIDSVQDSATDLILAVLGVHPVILGIGRSGATQSRVGAATAELERGSWNNTVIPLQDTFSEQIGRQLLPEFIEEDEIDNWDVGWNRSGVLSLQPDLLREAQRWAILMRAGAATRYDAKLAQGLEPTDADKVYVLPGGTQIVTGEPLPPPAPAEPPASAEPLMDPEQEQQRSLVHDAILITNTTKATLDEAQRGLIVAFAREAETLERSFAFQLEAAFNDLGERAVEAFWSAEGGASILAARTALSDMTGDEQAALAGMTTSEQTALAIMKRDLERERANGAATKQDEPDPDEIASYVARIIRGISFEEWEATQFGPTWDNATLRTLESTVSTVQTSLNLLVQIPDDVGRQIVADGGTRRGLIDITGQTRDSLYRALFEGRSNGEGPIQLASRIRGQVPAGRFVNAGPQYRSLLIARTETKYAQNESSLAAYEEAENITGLIVIDAQLGDTDAVCEAVDGRQVTFAEARAIGAVEHPGCTRSFAPVVAG